MRRAIKSAVAMTALAAAATTASAQPSANTEACVPEAQGVPGGDIALGAFYGPPLWAAGWPGADPNRAVDTRPDDPRWINAGGSSLSDTFTTGSSLAPVEVRTLSSTIEGGTYLYLSWTLNVGDVDGGRTVRLALAPTGQTAKVLRVRLPPALPRDVAGMRPIVECNNPATDTGDAPCDAANEAHYKVLTEVSANHFEYCNDSSAPATDACNPDNVSPDWIDQSLRGWKDASGVWNIQVRIPVVAGATRFAQGIAPNTAMAFDVAINTAGTFGHFKWPRSFAFTTSPLEDTEADAPATSAWGTFRSTTGAFPAPASGTCGGIRVEGNWGLGIIHNPTGATNYLTDPLTTAIRGAPGDVPVVNEFVVRVQNNSDKDIAVNDLKARFRIAKWGAQIGDVIGDDLNNAWHDVRGGSAVSNSSVIPAGTTGAIHFPWELNSTERCQYGVPSPTDAMNVGCVAIYYQHQCIMVDLTGSPSLDIDFETRGTWNNFDFSSLSTESEVATIDLRGLQPAPPPGTEVYVIGMARNMPRAATEGAQGASLVVDGAVAAASYEARIFGGEFYGAGRVGFNPQELELRAIEPPFHDAGAWADLPRVDLPPLLRYLPEPVYRRYRALAVLQRLKADADPQAATRALVSELGAADSTGVVPTLDIYALYKSPDSDRLLPLTSFTYFLSHQGGFLGMHWVIDGAERISDNVYRLRIPQSGAQEIRVRMQAQTPGEVEIKPDPDWKPDGGSGPVCQGCCCGRRARPASGLGSLMPALVVAIAFAVPRRRRKQR